MTRQEPENKGSGVRTAPGSFGRGAASDGPPAPTVDAQPRCWRCGRVLPWYAGRPWSLRCSRCFAENGSAPS